MINALPKITTPTLLVDKSRCQSNIQRMVQKAKAAKIDSQHGDLIGSHASCRPQHGTISAQNDDEVGVRSEEGLIKPVAYVIASEPRPGLEDELMQWALDRLEAYKHPRRIYLVDSLPTTHLGKIDRTRLKEMAAG